MATSVKELLFVGKDNFFAVKFKINKSNADFSANTRIEFKLNVTTVNSVDNPEYFDITGGVGEIKFLLGAAGYVAADSGLATICVFDAVNTNGVVYASPDGPTLVDVTVA
jgi:hypothetical protein